MREVYLAKLLVEFNDENPAEFMRNLSEDFIKELETKNEHKLKLTEYSYVLSSDYNRVVLGRGLGGNNFFLEDNDTNVTLLLSDIGYIYETINMYGDEYPECLKELYALRDKWQKVADKLVE